MSQSTTDAASAVKAVPIFHSDRRTGRLKRALNNCRVEKARSHLGKTWPKCGKKGGSAGL